MSDGSEDAAFRSEFSYRILEWNRGDPLFAKRFTNRRLRLTYFIGFAEGFAAFTGTSVNRSLLFTTNPRVACGAPILPSADYLLSGRLAYLRYACRWNREVLVQRLVFRFKPSPRPQA